jgi:hypothetical protein
MALDAITVEVAGQKEVIGWFDRYNELAVERLQSAIDDTCADIESDAVMRAPWYSGKLSRGISTRPPWGYSKKNPPPKWEVGRIVRSTAWHGALVEFGIGPLGVATAVQPEWMKRDLTNKFPFSSGAIGGERVQTGKPGIVTSGGKKVWSSGGSYQLKGGKPILTKLSRWAQKMGLSPWGVARGIQRRGGVKARPFLVPAWEATKPTFINRVRDALVESGPDAGKGPHAGGVA